MTNASTEMTIRNRSNSVFAFYLLLLFAAILAFLMIQQLGQTLEAPAALVASISENVPVRTSQSAKIDVVVHVLATLASVIGLGNLLAWGLRRIHQPAVIGF